MQIYYDFFKKACIFLCCFILIACNSSKLVLVQNLEQDSANTIILELGQNNIDSDKQIAKDGSYAVLIGDRDEIKALEVLKSSGHPFRKSTTLGDVFKKDSFISSPLEEQARFIYALEEQISGMIARLDGVTSVSTHVSLPPPSDNLWQSELISPSAAVLIKYKDGYRLEMYTNRIKQLVANSVPGLALDRVEIMLVNQR